MNASWNELFTTLKSSNELPSFFGRTGGPRSSSDAAGGALSVEEVKRSMRTLLLIRAYQVRGHILAKLDPLNQPRLELVPAELQPATYGFTESELDLPVFLGDTNIISGFLSQDISGHQPTIRQLLTRLKETYCGSIGVEYMHIPDREECNWIRERIETKEPFSFTAKDRINILDRLAWSTLFERFLGTKYGNTKRFGLEGCEALIPGMKAMIDTAATLGAKVIVMGMPHRGRLNMLANVVRKPLDAIFSEFNPEGTTVDDLGEGTGDVKYHLGTSYDRPTRSGGFVHLSMLANPSHLEAVNPVVLGKVRSKQLFLGDTERRQVVPVLIHGDAAFCGQGVSYETFDVPLFTDYNVGGTIHIVVNNQVGFTTDTMAARMPRASKYPTDVAKSAGAPIFHVNGDDPEAVVFVMNLAAEYRQAFKNDVVVDILCYRKDGHNEMDEPSFTQPLMYKEIRQKPNVLEKYTARLLQEGVVTQEAVLQIHSHIAGEFNDAFARKDQYRFNVQDWLSSDWSHMKSPKQFSRIRSTGVSEETFRRVARALVAVPHGFHVHKKLRTIMEKKKEMLEAGSEIDWATAEALAFGTLLDDGFVVRLSGQDVERGTFSHRHAVLHDAETNATHVPLKALEKMPGYFHACNSTLSEFGVLGYELGFSLDSPSSLVLWEAQFGDFVNGAQIIIDNFISAGQQKWLRQSGLVLLLPHGYDGQGPEHSSARLERFLQMCDGDPDVFPPMGEGERMQIQSTNMQIVNCTTPANYFHVLRRQMHRDFRKPLVLLTPKRLLKHKLAVSEMKDFLGNERFRRVLPDTAPFLKSNDKIRRLVLCSGNVYYDLIVEREEKKSDDVAIVRVEQLAPAPFDKIKAQAEKYPNAEIYWVQEEPKNMGAWFWMYHNIKTAVKDVRPKGFEPVYVGRPASASPATGSYKTHKKQLKHILDATFQHTK